MKQKHGELLGNPLNSVENPKATSETCL